MRLADGNCNDARCAPKTGRRLHATCVDESPVGPKKPSHDATKMLMDDLLALEPGDHVYDATVTVLGEFIRLHEHGVLFPQARKSDIDLAALGDRMQARKRTLTLATALPSGVPRPRT